MHEIRLAKSCSEANLGKQLSRCPLAKDTYPRPGPALFLPRSCPDHCWDPQRPKHPRDRGLTRAVPGRGKKSQQGYGWYQEGADEHEYSSQILELKVYSFQGRYKAHCNHKVRTVNPPYPIVPMSYSYRNESHLKSKLTKFCSACHLLTRLLRDNCFLIWWCVLV